MRSVDEWIGKTDDERVPRRVSVRVFIRADGRCADCRRRLRPGDKWDCDHIVALVNGGENRERNLQVLCGWCHKPKTVSDVAIKAKNYQRRAKHIGAARRTSRPLPCGRNSPFKKKINGKVVVR